MQSLRKGILLEKIDIKVLSDSYQCTQQIVTYWQWNGTTIFMLIPVYHFASDLFQSFSTYLLTCCLNRNRKRQFSITWMTS